MKIIISALALSPHVAAVFVSSRPLPKHVRASPGRPIVTEANGGVSPLFGQVSAFSGTSSRKGGGGGHSSQADLDNHADQCNPNNGEYWNSREDDYEDEDNYSQADLDNHANQMNPNNDEYEGDE